MEALLRQEKRTAACRAEWAGRSAVAEHWDQATRCLRLVRAEPGAICAFLPLSPLCRSAGSAAVVVYFCVSWGGKALSAEGKDLIKYLCGAIPGLDRRQFDAALPGFCEATGTDVRAFGPSAYEYCLAWDPPPTKAQRTKAARECLIRAQTADLRGPFAVATDIIGMLGSKGGSVGKAGNLVALLAA